MPLRLALLALAGLASLAGCASPDSPDARPAASSPLPSSDAAEAPADRAAAAGLSPAQAEALAGLGVPVAVPGALPDGWRVADLDVEAGDFARYAIRYEGPGGACFALVGETEGLGDRLVLAPPQQREVAIPALATHGPVVLAWSDATDRADPEGWPAGHASTDWFGTDGVAYAVDSPVGDSQGRRSHACARADIDDLASVVGSLRPLDPRDDGPTGVWALAEATGAEAASPEAAARALAGPDEEGGRTAVEVLHRRPRHAVVVVTRTGLADDSVRDERLRVTVVRAGEAWSAAHAVRQVRCQAGRGSAEWTAGDCL